MVIVQLESANSSGVGLKRQHQNVTHQSHVFNDILRVSVGWPWQIWLRQIHHADQLAQYVFQPRGQNSSTHQVSVDPTD